MLVPMEAIGWNDFLSHIEGIILHVIFRDCGFSKESPAILSQGFSLFCFGAIVIIGISESTF